MTADYVSRDLACFLLRKQISRRSSVLSVNLKRGTTMATGDKVNSAKQQARGKPEKVVGVKTGSDAREGDGKKDQAWRT